MVCRGLALLARPEEHMHEDLLLRSLAYLSSSVGLPPHSTASPVELRLRVGPHALRRKKPLFRDYSAQYNCPEAKI